MIRIIRTPKKLEGTGKEMKISQGYNNITGLFFIYITDRKTKLTLRINMDEEFYQGFHNMGNFTYRQTKKDEGEFKQEPITIQEIKDKTQWVDPDDEMKTDGRENEDHNWLK